MPTSLARRRARAGRKKGPVGRSFPISAPIKGWNTRDSRDAMDPLDAVIMDNYIPEVDGVRLRPGYDDHATGVGAAAVETLLSFQPSGTGKLLAADANNIYDATSTGAVGAAIVGATGLTNGRWEGVNMNEHILLGNGADHAKKYDGTTFQNVGTGSTSGLAFTDLISPFVFKGRIIWIEQNTTKFWYGAADAIDGTLNSFNLGFVMDRGGNLIKGVRWSLDGGDGQQNYAVFFTDEGEVIIYQGTNPGDANAWGLVGIYSIGSPINKRAIISFQNDILVVTEDDYVFLSEILKNDGVITQRSKLVGAVKENLSNRSLFGWHLVHYKGKNLIISNVPQADGNYQQHVINTVSQAGARFLDIKSHCWVTHDKKIYFGGDGGIVYEFDEGSMSDNGVAINGEVQSAFSALRSPQNKQVQAVQNIFQAEGDLDIAFEVLADFELASNDLSPTSTSSTGTPWGSPWGSPWGAAKQIVDDWEAAEGEGHKLSMHIKNQSAGQEITWIRTTYRVQPGVGL